MTLHEFWKGATQDEREEMAHLAKTSVNNLRNMAYGQPIGKVLAARLAEASDRKMTEMELLYPERYE